MPKVVDHDEYRKEILERCFNLFSRKGYSNVTMREIAAEVGVSTGTLYHYFPTKQSILEQMFTYVRETNVGEYLRRIADVDSVSDRLDTIAGFWNENEEFYQNVMLLAIDLFRNDDSGKSETVFNEFSDYYTKAMSDKLEVSTRFARSLFIYILGLIFHSILTPENKFYSKQVSILKNVLEQLLVKGRHDEQAGKSAEDLSGIFSAAGGKKTK